MCKVNNTLLSISYLRCSSVSLQIVVPGTTTTALLQQLLPDTDYNVGVVALYADGEGPTVSDAGKTRKNLQLEKKEKINSC